MSPYGTDLTMRGAAPLPPQLRVDRTKRRHQENDVDDPIRTSKRIVSDGQDEHALAVFQGHLPRLGGIKQVANARGEIGLRAPGGELDYVARGRMIGGFALVAYPARYGTSGVMTFLVNHQGAVFEKDLGSATARIAAGMTAFDPDSTWKKVANGGTPQS